jgi:hypothetical protein
MVCGREHEEEEEGLVNTDGILTSGENPRENIETSEEKKTIETFRL